MNKWRYAISLGSVVLILLTGCKKNKKDDAADFNRSAMLENLSTNHIVPLYSTSFVQTTSLKNSIATFTSNPDLLNLVALQNQFKTAYTAWQAIEVYEFGPAADYVLRSSVNSFPADTVKIKSNVTLGGYDLNVASNLRAKGFAALDFLLFGVGTTNSAILDMYTVDIDAAKRKAYLIDLSQNMYDRLNLAHSAWNSGYASTFISNSGTDLGSSVSLLVNNLSMSLETVRRERIGNALGYIGLVSTGVVTPQYLEAYYSNYSKELMLENLQKTKALYTGGAGIGFDDYLHHIGAKYENGNPLADEISHQFDVATNAVQALNPDVKQALLSDVAKVETAFLEVKKLIVLIKLDMASQLGVVISYSDNDGD